jgi:GNAT superfamily N-acetyltransferase
MGGCGTHGTIRELDYGRDAGQLREFLAAKDYARLEMTQEPIRAGDAFCLVAEVGGQIVGYAVVHVAWRTDQGWHEDGGTAGFLRDGDAYLENIEIHSDWRNRGIGLDLLQAVEARAALLGKRRIWLHTSQRNVGAARFYQRHGWKHLQTVLPVWNDHRPTLVYSKTFGAKGTKPLGSEEA